jgi:hypothetical protein
MGNRRAVPALARLLDASDARVRSSALQVMLELDGPDAVEALRRIVRTRGHPMRESAISGLSTISAWNSVPDLLFCLQDPSLPVQDAAAGALADLGAREAVPALLGLLHEDRAGRRPALGLALARLGGCGAAPRLLELLGHEDPGVVSSAIRSVELLKLSEALPALLGLARGDDLQVRPLAASALTRLGDPSEVPGLLDGGPRQLFLLNRLRRPDLWARLESSQRLRGRSGSPPRLWAEIACDAGLEFRLELHPDDEDWEEGRRNDSCRGGLTSPIEQLEESLDACSLGGILEDGQLRVLPLDAARRFWEEWWRRNPGR